MVWHTSFVTDTNTKEAFDKVYNHEYVVTLDELPDFSQYKQDIHPTINPTESAIPTESLTPTKSVTPTESVESIKVDLGYKGQWEDGCCGNVTIENNGKDIKGWKMGFDYEREIPQIRNAKILSHSGKHYVVQGESWQGDLEAGKTVTFGFLAGKGNVEAVLENVTVK